LPNKPAPDACSLPQNLVPTSDLISLLYKELRSLAAARLASESPAHTLTPTALVHEVYLRLNSEGHGWASKAQFFAAAAEAMRRVLVDHARGKGAQKRGGGAERVPLEGLLETADFERLDWIAIDEALHALAKQDERMHRVVMLRFFAGLSVEELAVQLGLSERTVKREWSVARVWLGKRLAGRPSGSPS